MTYNNIVIGYTLGFVIGSSFYLERSLQMKRDINTMHSVQVALHNGVNWYLKYLYHACNAVTPTILHTSPCYKKNCDSCTATHSCLMLLKLCLRKVQSKYKKNDCHLY